MQEKIIEIISKCLEVPADKINRETTLEDLDADSVLIVELMYNLEEAFDIEIGDDATDKVRTVGDLIDYISTLAK